MGEEMRVLVIAAVIVSVGLMCGCVSKSRYRALEAENSVLVALADDLKTSVKTYEKIFKDAGSKLTLAERAAEGK
jgi:outer membrane murein-binding lipoprotein Lpp